MQSLGNFIISNFSRAFSHLPLRISFLKASVKSLSKEIPDSLARIFAVSLVIKKLEFNLEIHTQIPYFQEIEVISSLVQFFVRDYL